MGGNPLQCSCLENPRDGGAWWAAVYGVAQSQTRLKRLSSSSMGLLCTNLSTTCPQDEVIKNLVLYSEWSWDPQTLLGLCRGCTPCCAVRSSYFPVSFGSELCCARSVCRFLCPLSVLLSQPTRQQLCVSCRFPFWHMLKLMPQQLRSV